MKTGSKLHKLVFAREKEEGSRNWLCSSVLSKGRLKVWLKMCSEHEYGCICPSTQDRLLSAPTLMPSLCRDQELGPSQPVDHGFFSQPGKHCSRPASPHPLAASRANGLHVPKELRIFVSGNQGMGTAEISRFPTS